MSPDGKALGEEIADIADCADDCTQLARAQRQGADKSQATSEMQHDEARKLEKMGLAPAKDLAEMKKKIAASDSVK